MDLEGIHLRSRLPGKRSRVQAIAKSGRYVRAGQVKPGERFFDVAVDATLRAALIRPRTPTQSGSPLVTAADLRKKLFKRPQKSLILFVVDASDSMGQGTCVRMKAAKGAALAVLAKARLHRHRVGMVAFRDRSARVVLQPTSSVSRARRQLKTMATGGATPFADGLMKAWQVIKAQRLKDPGIRALMVVISDGEANVAFDDRHNSMHVMEELTRICEGIGRDSVASVIIDSRPLSTGDDGMKRIARALGGVYHHISGLKARNVVDSLNRQFDRSTI